MVFEKYRPAVPTPVRLPDISTSPLSNLSTGSSDMDRARREMIREDRAKLAQDIINNIISKSKAEKIEDPSSLERYNRPSEAKDSMTYAEANAKYKQAENSFMGSAIGSKDPNNPSKGEQLISTIDPSFVESLLVPQTSAKRPDEWGPKGSWYKRNLTYGGPGVPQVYSAMIKLDKLRHSMFGIEYTPEQQNKLEVAEQALVDARRVQGLYGAEKVMPSGLSKEEFFEQYGEYETKDTYYDIAWHMNPLPKSVQTIGTAYADPLNYIPGAIFARALTTISKVLGITKAVAAARPLVVKMSQAMLGKKPIGAADEVLETVNVDKSVLGDITDPNFTVPIADEVNMTALDRLNYLAPDDILVQYTNSPWKDRSIMSKLKNLAIDPIMNLSKRLVAVYSPSTVVHSTDIGRRVTMAYGETVSQYDGAINQIMSTATGLFRQGKPFNITKDIELKSAGRVDNAIRANDIDWLMLLGTKTKKGIIDIQIENAIKIKKGMTRKFYDTTRKSSKLKSTVTSNTEMKTKVKYDMKAITNKIQQLKKDKSYIQKLYNDKTIKPKFNDMLEYQSLWKFSDQQKPFIEYYNTTILPYMQRTANVYGAVDEFINNEIGRRYFPRFARGKVVGKLDDKLEELYIQDGWTNAPHSLKSPRMSRELLGPVEEGGSTLDYFTDPLTVISQALRGVAKAAAHHKYEQSFSKFIKESTIASSRLAETHPNTIMIVGHVARALTAGRANKVTAKELNKIMEKVDDLSGLGQELDEVVATGFRSDTLRVALGKILTQIDGSIENTGKEFTDSIMSVFAANLEEIERLKTVFPFYSADDGTKAIKEWYSAVKNATRKNRTRVSVVPGIEGITEKHVRNEVLNNYPQESIDHLRSLFTRVNEEVMAQKPRINSLIRSVRKNSELQILGDEGLGDGLKFSKQQKAFFQKTILEPNKSSHLQTYNQLYTPNKIPIAGTEGLAPNFNAKMQNAAMSLVEFGGDISSALRFVATGFDVGWNFIQGPFLLTRNTAAAKGWGAIWYQTVKGLASKDFYGFHQQLYVNKQHVLNLGRSHGLMIQRGTEQTDALLSNKPWVTKTAAAITKGVEFSSKVLTLGKLHLENLPLIFHSSAEYGRLLMFESLIPTARIHALRATGLTEETLALAIRKNDAEAVGRFNQMLSKNLDDVADNANKTTGAVQASSYGLSPKQQATEAMLAFAPRFIRSQISLFSDVFRNDLKGELAQTAIANLGTSWFIFYNGACLATGQEPKNDPRPIDEGGDGPAFGSFIVPGTNVAIKMGGTMLTHLKFMIDFNMALHSGKALLEFISLDPKQNAFIKYAHSKIGPVLSLSETVLTGETYGGYDLTWKGDGVKDSFARSGESAKEMIGSHYMPFWGSSLYDSPGSGWGSKAAAGISEFVGFSSYATPHYQMRDSLRNEKSTETYGLSWSELDNDQQYGLRSEFPEIEALETLVKEDKSPRRGKDQDALNEYFEDIEIINNESSKRKDEFLSFYVGGVPGREVIAGLRKENIRKQEAMEKLNIESPTAVEYLEKPKSASERISYLDYAKLVMQKVLYNNPDLDDDDWTKRDVLEDKLRVAFGADLFNYIDRQWMDTHSESHPLEVEWHIARNQLNGWFKIRKTTAEEIKPGIFPLYEQWRTSKTDANVMEPERQLFIVNGETMQSEDLFKQIDKTVDNIEDMYRREHKDVDHILVRWFNRVPVNIENKRIGKEVLGRINPIDQRSWANEEAKKRIAAEELDNE